MDPRNLAALAILAAAVGAAALVGPAPASAVVEPPGFRVFHKDSALEPHAFREVFIVDEVSPGLHLATAELEVRRDGEPFAVTWDHERLERGATFWFVDEAFDQQRVLTAHWNGLQLMECRYGPAAGGADLTPDDLRAAGLGHKVRCLDELADG